MIRPSRLTRILLVALAAALGACDQQARRIITVQPPSDITEGQQTQLRLTISNILQQPIVPLALSLYVRPDPARYIIQRRTLGEVEYYKPLQATEVRYLPTLDRIEAEHVRDAGAWRHVPYSRFLHPRILFPGQSLSQTFQFQAHEPYRRLLYCDFYYLLLTGDRAAGHLFLRTKPETDPAPDADRYTEVFTRVSQLPLDHPVPEPSKCILFRPGDFRKDPPCLITRDIRLAISPQQFTYRAAARRARFGARTTTYLAAANTWVFDYADAGTWFIGPDTTTKLKGSYGELISGLESRNAAVLTLTAPRDPADKLLALLQKAGHSDPAATGANAVATIPADQLISVLEQAEALGYAISGTAWKPLQ